MNEEQLRRLKMQNDANAAAIARMNMQLQAQNARRKGDDDDDDDDAPVAQRHQPQQRYETPAQFQNPTAQQRYQAEDPNAVVLNHLVEQAAQKASENLANNQNIESKIKARMQRLVADYPALTQEDSSLVIKSREVYSRITQENPGLDEATKYELAVREAASVVGARPVNTPAEVFATSDFVMPVGNNPAAVTRSTKSRLTPQIIRNAQLMGINVDPNSVEGKKNLAELSEYSARFNADVNEDQYRYR